MVLMRAAGFAIKIVSTLRFTIAAILIFGRSLLDLEYIFSIDCAGTLKKRNGTLNGGGLDEEPYKCLICTSEVQEILNLYFA